MRALGQQTGRGGSAALARPRGVARGWRSHAAGDRYSRRVVLLKRVLPAIGLTLLLLVAAWPRLGPLLESVRLGFPAIDLREARELRMINPRYAGTDRLNRPYVVTSAIGRQVPNRDDLMSLERPRAEMTMHRGAVVVLTAATGIYQSRAQLVDLFDDVILTHENGTRFVTQRAHADLSDNTAEGHDPVEGHGPSGDITAQGFRILQKGDTIIFTGQSHLVLEGTKPSETATAPPALPAEIQKTAAAIEAAAAASPVAETAPRHPAGAVVKPVHAKPTAKPHPAAKSHLAKKHDAQKQAKGKPATGKPKRNAG